MPKPEITSNGVSPKANGVMPEQPVLLRQDAIVRAGVAVLLHRGDDILSDEDILMLRRAGSHGSGTWSVPSGWMDFGETPVETVCREMREELGVDVGVYGYDCWTNDVFRADGKHSLTLWLDAWIESGEPRIMEPDKISDLMWVHRRGPFPEPLFASVANRLGKGSL